MKKALKKTKKFMALILSIVTILSLNIATTCAAGTETDQMIIIGEYDGWLSECIDTEDSMTRASVVEVGLSDLDWKLEFVSDKTGVMLVSDSKDNLGDNIRCICDENSNISIVDETKGKSWSGKYSLKLSDKNAKSYELTFPDDVLMTGILGKREYANGKIAYSFIIYADDKIISFLSDDN